MKILFMTVNRIVFSVTLSFVCSVSFAQNIAEVLFGKNCKKDYIGQYNYNGKRKNGFGIERYRNGSVYIGDFSENEISGRGMLILNGGKIPNVKYAVVYVGNWLKGKKNGSGTCYDTDGNVVYQGKFSNDKPLKQNATTTVSKRFSMLSVENDLYLGEVLDGIPDGFGLTVREDGSIIYGSKKQGQWQGTCMTYYSPDVWEVGQWKNGEYNAFHNSQIADADLVAFKIALKESNKEIRQNLKEAFGYFAQAAEKTMEIVHGIQGKVPTEAEEGEDDDGIFTSSSKSSKGTSGKSSSNKPSGNEASNKNRDSNSYSNYESQLVKMNTYHESQYDDSQRRSIQQKMKSIRKKWESKGYKMFHSQWEDWDGRKK